MILLFNVFITNTGAHNNLLHNRGHLKQFSSLDITKYSISSLSKLHNWKRVIMNIELDLNFYTEDDSKKLKEFIEKEFAGIDIIFNKFRITLQEEWLDIYNSIDEDLIFYLGNHDHIFLDSQSNYFNSLLNEVSKFTYGTLITSHFPENIRWAKCGYIDLNEEVPKESNIKYGIENNYLTYSGISIDSLNVLTKELFHDWFSIGDWGDTKIYRSDGVTALGGVSILTIRNHINIPLPEQKMIIPFKEQFRHFDGYNHQKVSNEVCPSLSIPSGFFEDKIKIRFGYDDYKQGWVNLNPMLSYRAFDKTGIDEKFLVSDIPLFWKDKIIDIDENPDISEEEMVQHRLYSILQMIYSDERYNHYIDKTLEQKIMKAYVSNYKKYTF